MTKEIVASMVGINHKTIICSLNGPLAEATANTSRLILSYISPVPLLSNTEMYTSH